MSSLLDPSFRPTFFELFAAERLTPGLKGALLYALGVAAQRRPSLIRVLDWGDEVYALFSAVLEGSTLASSSATFAESLYALRRAPAGGEQAAAGGGAAAAGVAGARGRLSAKQRLVCLLWLVLVPYLRDKAAAAYAKRQEAQELGDFGLDEVLGADEHGALGDTQQEEQDGGSTSAVAAQQEGEDQPRWRSAVEGVAARVYPWAHLALEGASFGYMLGYLLGATEHFSPAMAMAGVVPRRVTAAEAASAEAVQKRRRNAAVQRAAGRAGGAARAATVRTAHAVSDSARVLLVGAVLGYKVLEWWYNSAEEKLNAGKTIAPPPPPPALPPAKVADGGVGLPKDVKKARTHCPICLKKRVNPALVSVSGYAFCYPCVYRYVTDHKKCPVSQVPCDHDDIVRIFANN